MRQTWLVCLCSICSLYAMAQVKSDRFKPLSPQDFTVVSPVVDSNSNAVILADVGTTEFDGNNNGDFTLIFKQHKRILIRNRNAFDEATVKVPVYIGANFTEEEKFEDFEATTYNLENGQVVATKLDKTAVLSEKMNREYTIRKFTFSNVKEGSIIDFKYTVKSPFYRRLRSWYFQDSYPCLWSEYSVTIPPMFNYIRTQTGYLPYKTDSAAKIFKTYTVAQNDQYGNRNVYSFSGDAIYAKWAMKDVPAFKAEAYVSSSRNLISNIKFQLHSIKFSETSSHFYLKDWFATSADLMKDDDFGLQLTQPLNWADDITKKFGNAHSAYEQAKLAFAYVRDNYKCNDHDARQLSQTLKKTFQTKTGNVADLNLLLTALLINSGFEAEPVLLSTRDNGFANEAAAIVNQYNYVLSRVRIDTAYYLLDASHNNLGFGKLTSDSYNKYARVVSTKMPAFISLSTDSLEESKTTMVFITNNEKGDAMEAGYTSNLGYNESLRLRNKLEGMKQEEYFREIKKDYPSDMTLSAMQIDSIKQCDEPVTVRYDIKMNFNGEELIYFTPLLTESWKKNPFTSAERLFPVEMPYKISETYILNMEVPKGYVVDEIPKSAKVNFNDGEGAFEYIIAKSGDNIQLRSKLVFNKSVFEPEDYQTLRDFFAFIVNKHAEQIVFKKKS